MQHLSIQMHYQLKTQVVIQQIQHLLLLKFVLSFVLHDVSEEPLYFLVERFWDLFHHQVTVNIAELFLKICNDRIILVE